MNFRDLKLSDLTDIYPMSVRLRHLILAGVTDEYAPFSTLGEYCDDIDRNRKFLFKQSGFGRKSIKEFDDLIARAVVGDGINPKRQNNSLPARIKDIKFSDLITIYPVSARLRNIFLAIAEDTLAPFSTVGEYCKDIARNRSYLTKQLNCGRISIREFDELIALVLAGDGQNSESSVNSLPAHIKDLSFMTIVDIFPVSTRLKKRLIAYTTDPNAHFKTFDEYLSNVAVNRAKLFECEGIGATTRHEFDNLVDQVLGNNGAIVLQNEITDDPTAKKNELARVINSVRLVENKYPGVFDSVTSAARALSTISNVTRIDISAVDKRLNLILGDDVRASIVARRFNGGTLQAVGDEFGVSRERVRQIERRFIGLMTDTSDLKWVNRKLQEFGAFESGQLPSDEQLDRIHPCLKSALKFHFVDAETKIVSTTKQLTPQERQAIAVGTGLALDVQSRDILEKHWSLKRVIAEVREFAISLGKPDLMPKQTELGGHDRQALRGAIGRFGGQSKIAQLAGLKYQGQLVGEDGSRIYWTDQRALSFLRDVAERCGHPDLMPTQTECRTYAPNPVTVIAGLTKTTNNAPGRSWLELAELAGLRVDKDTQKRTIGYIKSFVQSLGDALDHLSPAEVFVLFEQQNLTKTGENRNTNRSFDNLVEAIQSGYLPSSIVKEWATGGESDLIENLLDQNNSNVEDAFLAAGKVIPKKKRLTQNLGKGEELEDVEQRLPIPSAIDTLKALDKATELLVKTSSDDEAISFLVAKAASKLWARCFECESDAVAEAITHTGNLYSTEAKQKFLREYEASKNLQIPRDYQFIDEEGNSIQPKLMQRLIAYKVLNDRRVLNLSGTGTGKTLSAVLASRVINAKLTVVSCPNATVSGWTRTILNAFPNSEVITKTLAPEWETNYPHYLVVNHEIFQDRNEGALKRFLQNSIVDFIVIDELHQVKQRDARFESQRRRLMTGLITDIPSYREKPRVLGMSATPVINNLYEGKSLVELVSGVEHSEIGSDVTIENCMRLYQRFTTMGFRMVASFSVERMPRIHEIDASGAIPSLIALGRGAHPQQIEAILVRERWPAIKSALRKKTVVFTDYVKDVVPFLIESIRNEGYSVGAFTGNDKDATELGFTDMLDQFLHGDVDVLVASIRTAGTGIDGLQHICNNVIFATLPWTCTDYEQAVGRFDREGVKFGSLDIHIPKTYALLDNGERWSWCERKLARIENKRDIAKASVDGEIPDTLSQLTPQKATKYWMNWLERLNEHGISTISRIEIRVPLNEDAPEENSRRFASYGDFSKLNARWNQAHSSVTHQRLTNNPEEWCFYHTRMRENEKEWLVVPRVECINHLTKNLPLGAVIGDFGAGEAGLARALHDIHTVYSFDHIAIDDSVIQCDMAATGLEPAILDAVVFSLSLMGRNIKDYILEAYRTLKPGGQLIIWHTQSGVDLENFADGLGKLGFAVVQKGPRWKWNYIWAIKEGTQKDIDVELHF